jgi:hypothetical protein
MFLKLFSGYRLDELNDKIDSWQTNNKVNIKELSMMSHGDRLIIAVLYEYIISTIGPTTYVPITSTTVGNPQENFPATTSTVVINSEDVENDFSKFLFDL